MAPTPSLLIGEHPSVEALRNIVQRIAASKAKHILIYGETGTGKGVVARLIHQLSRRSGQPFVDINCAAIPDSLLESELFGYEKGAFTGAGANKQGLIEAANGGFLFLDEIRELTPTMQAKILTLLDTQQFRRVGSVRSISVDVRFIAATNKILLSEVNAGKFREDLYYRLQVVAINLPPLRDRGADVLILAKNFLTHFNWVYGSHFQKLDPAVEEAFLTYHWPGNIRELENLIERICILEEGDTVRLSFLPDRIIRQSGGRTEAAHTEASRTASGGARPQPPDSHPAPPDPPRNYHDATADFQRSLIVGALRHTGGNLGQAAQRLQISRHALHYQLRRLGLSKQYQEPEG